MAKQPDKQPDSKKSELEDAISPISPDAPAAPPAPEIAPLIQVRAAHKTRVGFFEQHKAHPNGEAYVAGEQPVKIARTANAIQALKKGTIIEVTE